MRKHNIMYSLRSLGDIRTVSRTFFSHSRPISGTPVLAVCHAASHTGTPRDTDLLAFLNSEQATPGHTGTLIS